MNLPSSPVVRPSAELPVQRPVLAFVDTERGAALPVAALDTEARRLHAAGLLSTEGGTVLSAPSGADDNRPVYLAAIAGEEPQALRLQAAEAIARLQAHGHAACSVVLPEITATRVQAIAEGIFSANHRFESSGPARDRCRRIEDLDFVMADRMGAVADGLHAGWLTSMAALSARHLATEPANELTPPVFVERCRTLARQAGFSLSVMGRKDLEAAGMGGLLTVAAGSRHGPFLVRMDWLPSDCPDGMRPLVLVGKTVTFDSGGISLKKAEDMDHMKADMGGGAAVFGAMVLTAELRPRFPVTAIFAVAENMPGPDAMRPSDVIRMASGATVEIINTDAEGRLILADALHFAAGLAPVAVIDLATLTGASLGIFGPIGTATFANDDAWFERLAKADRLAGEKIWRLPLWPEYRKFLKSPVADLRNFSTTGQNGSTPVAAAFLSHFVGAHPWMHLDIYNTCWNRHDTPLMPQGPTGSGSRVLAQLLLDLDSEARFHRPNLGWPK
jgi:leucyl aminopeptidase